MKYKYVYQLAIAFDQTLNALLGGWADETLSARCWRLRESHKLAKIGVTIIDILFFFDPNHCETSYESEKNRFHLAPEYRKDKV